MSTGAALVAAVAAFLVANALSGARAEGARPFAWGRAREQPSRLESREGRESRARDRNARRAEGIIHGAPRGVRHHEERARELLRAFHRHRRAPGGRDDDLALLRRELLATLTVVVNADSAYKRVLERVRRHCDQRAWRDARDRTERTGRTDYATSRGFPAPIEQGDFALAALL